MKVRIKRLDGSVELPKYQTDESAGFDIAASADITIQSGEIKLISTGLIVEAPHGYYLLVTARSSTPRKTGLSMPHGVGIVDRDYSGPEDEIKLQFRNFTDKAVEIKKGDRIAQGLFVPVNQAEWEEVDEIRSD